jgi:hypothetical protein
MERAFRLRTPIARAERISSVVPIIYAPAGRLVGGIKRLWTSGISARRFIGRCRRATNESRRLFRGNLAE